MKAKNRTKRRTVRSMHAPQQRQVKPLNLNSPKYKKSRLYDRDGDLRDGIYEVRPITEEEKALVAQMGSYH